MFKKYNKKTLAIFSAVLALVSIAGAYGLVNSGMKSKLASAKEAEAKKADDILPVAEKEVAVATAQQETEKSSPSTAIIETAKAAIETVAPAAVQTSVENKYPVHQNISTTYFWVGEEADADNKNISNSPSAWDEQWATHFGGVDDPKKRNGFVVAKFVPKENSFYFALPYNDFDENGNRKKDVNSVIPWASSKKWGATESIVKNQWIKITKGGKTAYAQWEDVGPFKEDDQAYVFGSARPKSKTNDNAGLDVSPAVKDFLGLGDVDKTDWQFVDAQQVPDGPWKGTITNSQISWT
ncbi:MAG: hypothetical protein PHW24_03005 [Candidatus Moranbacteria bacterium]|nr:hypothetical protein [Candidatus Moranbacteria bacterium]